MNTKYRWEDRDTLLVTLYHNIGVHTPQTQILTVGESELDDQYVCYAAEEVNISLNRDHLNSLIEVLQQAKEEITKEPVSS